MLLSKRFLFSFFFREVPKEQNILQRCPEASGSIHHSQFEPQSCHLDRGEILASSSTKIGDFLNHNLVISREEKSSQVALQILCYFVELLAKIASFLAKTNAGFTLWIL